MNEQDIENFCDITNASTEEARNFLQVNLLQKTRFFSGETNSPTTVP